MTPARGPLYLKNQLPHTSENSRNICHQHHDELRSSFGISRNVSAVFGVASGNPENKPQIAGTLRETSKPPCKLQGHFGKPRNHHANCRVASGSLETTMQIAGSLREIPTPPRNLCSAFGKFRHHFAVCVVL